MVRLLHGKLGRSVVALLGVCLAASLVWAQQSLHVIELQHRTAEEVIPVLQPLVESGGVVTGSEYKLFVRTSSSNLAELRRALAAIDRQQQQLLVSVRQSTRQEIERERLSASGTISTGDAGVAVNERPRERSGVTVHGTDASLGRQGSSIASVQVLEGNSAFIARGESVPIVTTVIAVGGRRPWIGGSTAYRDLQSGFEVTPRVAGDEVILEIAQGSERLGSRNNIETQHLTTHVRGPLGEWLQLGGIDESSVSRQRGILNRSYTTSSDERSLWIKVELSSPP